MTDFAVDALCTFHRAYRELCGRPEEDAIHVRLDERMRRTAHIWRHDPRESRRLARQLEGRAR